ncbi:MAG: methyltransferase domain-containing protein [Chitinophagales bacterium]|nr:methyltransferase domain-containing protein [Chitinophagales bacterium]
MAKNFYRLYNKFIFWYQFRIRKNRQPLKEMLERAGKRSWLDVGASLSRHEGFHYTDIIPENEVPETLRDRYTCWNATLPPTDAQKTRLGTFDLIRMQHVFEHFTPEDGIKVLRHCYDLLNPGGYLLITVPDLKKFVWRYCLHALDDDWKFATWAHTRIQAGAPQSFYFSVFTHSVPHQSHQWCYDRSGLEYQIRRSIQPYSIEFLSPFHKLASIPFTHNRPLEDLCVLIRKP